MRQCELLELARSSYYYEPIGESAENLHYLRLIDEQYLRTPFYGSRQMTVCLQSQGYAINRKRVQRLMRRMGLEGLAPGPRTSQPGPEHKIYPYLLRDLEITRPDQVWATDITYVPMPVGFMYLVAIIDWYSRYVLAWELSNMLDTGFCLEALETALDGRRPEIFNSDQGGTVHQRSVHAAPRAGQRAHQHGRPWPGFRQHFRRTALAYAQVRGHLPERLSERHRATPGTSQLLRVF